MTRHEFGGDLGCLSFCERSTASAWSKWHIRRVGPEGQKFGGGAPDTVLCGAELHKGWDLQSPVTRTALLRLEGDVCAKCAALAVQS